MTLLFRKGLGPQDVKSSKDATEALEFCLVQNIEALHSIFDLGQIPCLLKCKGNTILFTQIAGNI